MQVNSVGGLGQVHSLSVGECASTAKRVLSRYKEQNQKISLVVGGVAAVAAVALYLFVLIYYVIIPGNKKIPNPDYDPNYKAPAKGRIDGTKIHPTREKSISAVLLGIEGAVIGTPFVAVIAAFALGKATSIGLKKLRRKPLSILLQELYSRPSNHQMDSHADLIRLIKLIDNKGRKELVKQMDFEQLGVAETTLGRRRFSRLISDVDHDAAHKWKQIIEFGRLSPSKMEKALGDSGNQEFQEMVKTSPEILPRLRQGLYQQHSLSARKELISAFDKLLGQEDNEKVLIKIGKQSLEFPKKWIEAKSQVIGALLADAQEGMIEDLQKEGKITELVWTSSAVKPDLLIQALRVLRGDLNLPIKFSDLQQLAKAADYLEIDDLLLMTGDAVIRKAQRKRISDFQLLKFIDRYIPEGNKTCGHLRDQAIKVVNFKKIASLKEFTKFWPVAKNFPLAKTACLDYFKQLLKEPKLHSLLCEKAEDLKDDELKQLCLDVV